METIISLLGILSIFGCCVTQVASFSHCELHQHRFLPQQRRHLDFRTTTTSPVSISYLQTGCPTKQYTTTFLSAKSKSKGFGKSPTNNKSTNDRIDEKSNETVKATTATPVTTTTASTISVKQQEESQQQRPQSLNSGQAALEKMRRERAEAKDAELRKVREMLQADEQIRKRPSSGDDSSTATTAAAIPEKVAIRMGKRMIPFVGIPLFLAMGTFVGFWYMATYRGLEFQPVLVAGSTIFLLFVGLLVRSKIVSLH
jgi:Photosynthesis affected mutant 68